MIQFILTLAVIWIVLRVLTTVISLPFRLIGFLAGNSSAVIFWVILTILVFVALRHPDVSGLYRMKNLYRSREDKLIAGVCGGIAECFGVSALLVRLVFVLLTIFGGGTVILAYVIAALFIPEKPWRDM